MDIALDPSAIQPQEYFLQGVIMQDNLENALQKLKGISDNSDEPIMEFTDHEIGLVMTSKTNSLIPSQALATFRLKIRHSLIFPDAPYYVRYQGPIENTEKNLSTLYRTSLDVPCTSNALNYFLDMGFQQEYEFVAKGYLFHKGKLKVTLSKLFTVTKPNKYEDLEPISSSYAIEFSIIAPPSQRGLADMVKLFADQLKPVPLGSNHHVRLAKFVAEALWCKGTVRCPDVLVSLPCGQFSAHKLVLAAHSPIFADIWLKDPKLNVYDLRAPQYNYITRPGFESILAYVYTGECAHVTSPLPGTDAFEETRRIAYDFTILGLIDLLTNAPTQGNNMTKTENNLPFGYPSGLPSIPNTNGLRESPVKEYSPDGPESKAQNARNIALKFVNSTFKQSIEKPTNHNPTTGMIPQPKEVPFNSNIAMPYNQINSGSRPAPNMPLGQQVMNTTANVPERCKTCGIVNQTATQVQRHTCHTCKTDFNPGLPTKAFIHQGPLQSSAIFRMPMSICLPPQMQMRIPSQQNTPQIGLNPMFMQRLPRSQYLGPQSSFMRTPQIVGGIPVISGIRPSTMTALHPRPTYPPTIRNIQPGPFMYPKGLTSQRMNIQCAPMYPLPTKTSSWKNSMLTVPVKNPQQLMAHPPIVQQTQSPFKLVDRRLYQNLSNDGFLRLSLQEILLVLTDDDLSVIDELQVFLCAWKWINFDYFNRWRHLQKVMHCVRFPLLSVRQLLMVSRELEAYAGIYDLLLGASWYHTCLHLDRMDNMYYQIPKPRTYYTVKIDPLSIYQTPRELRQVPILSEWTFDKKLDVISSPTDYSGPGDDETAIRQIMGDVRHLMAQDPVQKSDQNKVLNTVATLYDDILKGKGDGHHEGSDDKLAKALLDLRHSIEAMRQVTSELNIEAQESLKRMTLKAAKKPLPPPRPAPPKAAPKPKPPTKKKPRFLCF